MIIIVVLIFSSFDWFFILMESYRYCHWELLFCNYDCELWQFMKCIKNNYSKETRLFRQQYIFYSFLRYRLVETKFWVTLPSITCTIWKTCENILKIGFKYVESINAYRCPRSVTSWPLYNIILLHRVTNHFIDSRRNSFFFRRQIFSRKI